MDFKDLYKFCDDTIAARKASGQRSVVLANEIKAQLIAGVGWLSGINFHPVDSRAGDPHGHYECHGEAESRWEDDESWVALITYNRTLNICRQRFVVVKEMMHIFDTEEGQVRDAAAYRGLLGEIELRPLTASTAYDSENFARWMALLLLCPKRHRDQILAERAQAAIDGVDPKTNYQIALEFRIPESVVPSLFSPYYESAYERLIVE